MTNQHNYYSYLLRLWSADDQGQVIWRALLEDPRTGARLHFSSLQRLFAFLEDQTTPDAGDTCSKRSKS
jgi:hypothetical protein